MSFETPRTIVSGHRQATARPSGVAPTASIALPPYEQPSHPLSHSAQQALNNLAQTATMNKLKNHYAAVETLLPKIAGEVNDVLYARDEKAKQRRARRAKQGLEEEEGTDEELQNTKEIVGEMTKKMEVAMRKGIDGKVVVEDMEDGIVYLRQNALRLTQAESQTQLTQRRQHGRRRGARRQAAGEEEEAEEDEDMEDEEYDSPGPTPLNMQGIEITGPSKLWKNRLREKKDKWEMASHTARYAENNSYIGFKQVVNDAQHPGGDVPLPHASTWFTERGEPAIGVTMVGGEGDEDDDLIMERGIISTKCPLTLQEFKDPVSSKKCPHSFERSAIMEMIDKSTVRTGIGPRAGDRAVQCPVPGCDKTLCASDLGVDPLVVRMIERTRKAKDQASDDEDDGDESNQPSGSSMLHAESLVSSPAGAVRTSATHASRARSRMPEQQPPPSSIVLDLGGSDYDSDETEED